MGRKLSERNLAELGAHLDSGKGPEELRLSPPEKKKKRGNEESEIQKSCIKWWAAVCNGFGVDEFLLFSIPNGAVLGHDPRERAIRAAILKAEGMRPGVPDLFLAVRTYDRTPKGTCGHTPGANGLFIEMKTERGRESEEQIAMSERILGAGYACKVCRSLTEFKQIITQYLT